jgi:uncharacterized protein
MIRRKNGGIAVIKTIAKQSCQKDDLELQQEALLRQAKALLEEAALEHDHPTALVHLGSSAWLEHENVEKAQEYYRKAGEQGSAEGWYNLGTLLWPNNEDPIAKNQAMVAFHKAIELGDADAMYFVGVDYLSQEAEEELSQLGLKWIQSAADVDHSGALHYLALLYLEGDDRLGIKPCSMPEFHAYLDKACAAESANALFLRGHAYYHGEHDLEQDYGRALQDFLAAAEGGHADAAVSAGATMLYWGFGQIVPRNQERAFQLYKEAGELGS